MRLIGRVRDMSRLAAQWRRRDERIGFVPTMGALHEGHLSLIREARRRTDVVVVSVFVNPLQFGPREDYRRYPRHLSRDVRLARSAGADLIFAPSAREMYPTGFSTSVDVGDLGDRLEGARRPGHFRGVATVVLKLLELVRPTVAYFGQKDYQQTLVIRRLVRDLNLPVAVRVMPTVREADGLAMSSRNAYLSAEERRQAPVIFQALQMARATIRRGERRPERLKAQIRAAIRRRRLIRVQDVSVVDAETLQPPARLVGRVAILVAARVGSTRLIDNILVDVP